MIELTYLSGFKYFNGESCLTLLYFVVVDPYFIAFAHLLQVWNLSWHCSIRTKELSMQCYSSQNKPELDKIVIEFSILAMTLLERLLQSSKMRTAKSRKSLYWANSFGIFFANYVRIVGLWKLFLWWLININEEFQQGHETDAFCFELPLQVRYFN